MEPIPETSARVWNVYPTEKGASMKTFWSFFTGTTGVILAIILCNLILLVGCVLSAVVIPIAFPFPTGTP